MTNYPVGCTANVARLQARQCSVRCRANCRQATAGKQTAGKITAGRHVSQPHKRSRPHVQWRAQACKPAAAQPVICRALLMLALSWCGCSPSAMIAVAHGVLTQPLIWLPNDCCDWVQRTQNAPFLQPYAGKSQQRTGAAGRPPYQQITTPAAVQAPRPSPLVCTTKPGCALPSAKHSPLACTPEPGFALLRPPTQWWGTHSLCHHQGYTCEC